jgi:hypothetical protein
VGRERECELECMGTVNCIPSIFARLGQLWQYLVVETRLIRGNRGHRPSRGGRRGGSAPPASSGACHVRCTGRRLSRCTRTPVSCPLSTSSHSRATLNMSLQTLNAAPHSQLTGSKSTHPPTRSSRYKCCAIS